ncbi:MAG TPA: aldo/keto reductase [Bacteroidales bacterium]
MSLNRRNFLKLSGAGIAGGAIIKNSGTTFGQSLKPSSTFEPKKLVYRTLGKTGLKIPIVSLPVERIDNENLVKEGIAAGIILFDTAYSYGQGRSEEFLGEALKSYDRKKLLIATKISTKDKENPEKDLLAKFEKSLQRLQTDYVDILYLHAVDKREDVLNPVYLKVFRNLKNQGKAKFIGVSTHKNMAEVLKAAVESKVWEVVLTAYNFRMENSADVIQAVAEASNAGLGIVAMKTMAGGYWDKERTKKINARAALKWVLNNENITTAIPAITNFEMLDEDLKVMEDLTLTDQEKQDLQVNNSTTGLFCLGCEHCRTQCPHNAPVPELMRAYMYAYGYNDTKLARKVVDEMSDQGQICTACPVCHVKCRQGFKIKEKVTDIVRIKQVPIDFLV